MMKKVLRAGVALVSSALWLTGCSSAAPSGLASPGSVDSRVGRTPTVLAQPCPTASPLPAGQGVAIDYVPTVVWRGHHYDAMTGDAARPGRALFAVRCAIDAIGKSGSVPVPEPWPDGTADLLPVGTVIYAVRGSDPACRITDGQTVYDAVDPRAKVLTPSCPPPGR